MTARAAASNLYPAGHPRHIPEAWPALLSEDQLLAYIGGMSRDTLRKVCPVAPVDLGANLLRYQRSAIDSWISGLPLRESDLRKKTAAAEPAEVVDFAAVQDRAMSAVDRVRARSKKASPCRKRNL